MSSETKSTSEGFRSHGYKNYGNEQQPNMNFMQGQQQMGYKHADKKKSKGNPNFNDQNPNMQNMRGQMNPNRPSSQGQYIQQPNMQQFSQQPNIQDNLVLSALSPGPQNFPHNQGYYQKGGKRNQMQQGQSPQQQMGPNLSKQNQFNQNMQQPLTSPSGDNTNVFFNPKMNQTKEFNQGQMPNKFQGGMPGVQQNFMGNVNTGTGLISPPNMGMATFGTQSPVYQNQTQFFPSGNMQQQVPMTGTNAWVSGKQGPGLMPPNFQMHVQHQNQIPQQNFMQQTGHSKVNIDISTSQARQGLKNSSKVDIKLRFEDIY
mgnify:FL=1